MPLSNVAIVNVWHAVPVARRIAILAMSIIEMDNAAVPAIESLIGLVVCMTRQLNNEQRAQLVDRLKAEAETPEVLNRPALH